MNSNQRSEANNQSNNGGNELAKPSSRAFSAGRTGDDETAAPDGGRGDAQTATHEPNDDVAGGSPARQRGHHLAADQNMDDDSGLSNTANRTSSELERDERQERQSNVGRRSDGTPD